MPRVAADSGAFDPVQAQKAHLQWELQDSDGMSATKSAGRSLARWELPSWFSVPKRSLDSGPSRLLLGSLRQDSGIGGGVRSF